MIIRHVQGDVPRQTTLAGLEPETSFQIPLSETWPARRPVLDVLVDYRVMMVSFEFCESCNDKLCFWTVCRKGWSE